MLLKVTKSYQKCPISTKSYLKLLKVTQSYPKCPIGTKSYQKLFNLLANDQNGHTKHEGIDKQENTNGYEKPKSFGLLQLEKTQFFIESRSVGTAIFSGKFGDEGTKGNEKGEDVAGDHVHSVSFGIRWTSTKKLPKIIKSYLMLPKVIKSYKKLLKLPKVTKNYQNLPKVTQSFQKLLKLPKVTKNYLKLPKVV